MFSYIWHTIFFDPLYNALVFFIDAVPHGDVGLAIILVTVLVKLVLLPLSLKAARTQRAMQLLQPKLSALKEQYKDNREMHAREMMALYKEAGVNPFSTFFLFLIQIPFIIALYLTVYSGGGVKLPLINVELLYSFIPNPETVRMTLLGALDIASRSVPLAILAGITQYFQAVLTLPKAPPKEEGKEPSFMDDLSRSMNTQMRYVMPLIIAFVAYTASVIALYFVVSNVLGILQEYFVRKDKAKEAALTSLRSK